MRIYACEYETIDKTGNENVFEFRSFCCDKLTINVNLNHNIKAKHSHDKRVLLGNQRRVPVLLFDGA